MAKLTVGAVADWRCSQCGSRWNALRLATVAAYAVWVAEHPAASTARRQEIVIVDDLRIVREPSR